MDKIERVFRRYCLISFRMYEKHRGFNQRKFLSHVGQELEELFYGSGGVNGIILVPLGNGWIKEIRWAFFDETDEIFSYRQEEEARVFNEGWS